MFIRSLKIENIAGIDSYTIESARRLNVVTGYMAEYVITAIGALICDPVCGYELGRVMEENSLIQAVVRLHRKIYKVTIRGAPGGKPDFSVRIRGSDQDVTDEYRKLVRESSERNALSFFQGDKKNRFEDRLARYKDTGFYYSRGEFEKLTDGIGNTQTFRNLLRDYMRGFETERLRADKELYFELMSNGKFQAVFRREEDEKAALSESEKMLFQAFCFIHINHFWNSVDEIRSIEPINRPVLISGLMERIDASVDIQSLIKSIMHLGRQIFITAWKAEDERRILEAFNPKKYEASYGSTRNGT